MCEDLRTMRRENNRDGDDRWKCGHPRRCQRRWARTPGHAAQETHIQSKHQPLLCCNAAYHLSKTPFFRTCIDELSSEGKISALMVCFSVLYMEAAGRPTALARQVGCNGATVERVTAMGSVLSGILAGCMLDGRKRLLADQLYWLMFFQ